MDSFANIKKDLDRGLLRVTDPETTRVFTYSPGVLRDFWRFDKALRNSSFALPVITPGGYDQFATLFNAEPPRYKMATYDFTARVVISPGPRFPLAELLDHLADPETPSTSTKGEYSERKRKIINGMLWDTAESKQRFLEKQEQRKEERLLRKEEKKEVKRAAKRAYVAAMEVDVDPKDAVASPSRKVVQKKKKPVDDDELEGFTSDEAEK
ncbi:hypothetical protein OE88DRAFT_1647414 [Heliocybe sulcata]|uniref:Uncharacterized protein n=1 Tax=Heliocybe sulcata TaxID=5364 RepID=A0A5C3MSZ0_9AGAM|nr:hypothetical protein OE88DRAFT_1647414 [Heliocybe sulcata]